MTDDDDLTAELFAPLLRPGDPEELAGEAAVLSAFRAARRDDLRRRRRRRAAAGSAGTLVFVLATGGVAAAYSGHLPAPLQGAVHEALGGVGVPAPARLAPPSHPAVSPAARSSAPPTVEPRSAPAPSHAPSPAASPRPTLSAAPVARPAPTSSPRPAAQPTPVPAPTLTIRLSATTVPVHHAVTVRGTLAQGSRPQAGQVVYAATRVAGATAWSRVGRATTDSAGQVAIPVKDLLQNVQVRLATADRVVSPARQVTVLPVVHASTTQVDATTRAIRATTEGARPKDAVVLERREGTTWKVIRTSTLNANAAVTFRVGAPGPGSSVRYRVRVKASSTHGVGLAVLTLSG